MDIDYKNILKPSEYLSQEEINNIIIRVTNTRVGKFSENWDTCCEDLCCIPLCLATCGFSVFCGCGQMYCDDSDCCTLVAPDCCKWSQSFTDEKNAIKIVEKRIKMIKKEGKAKIKSNKKKERLEEKERKKMEKLNKLYGKKLNECPDEYIKKIEEEKPPSYDQIN